MPDGSGNRNNSIQTEGYPYSSLQKQYCLVAATAHFYFLVYVLPDIPAEYGHPAELHQQSFYKKIIDAPNFDRNKALEQQIELLTMKKEHLENLISFARGIKGIGVKYMDFKVFDTTKIDEYSKRAKEQWGQTSEYKEFEEKTKNWTKDDEATVANEFMQLFVEFGQMKEMDPEDEQVQLQVRKLQDYITDHFYTCSDKILCGLGRMYAGGGELTENIDDVGGVGTAEFASKAIDIFYMSGR